MTSIVSLIFNKDISSVYIAGDKFLKELGQESADLNGIIEQCLNTLIEISMRDEVYLISEEDFYEYSYEDMFLQEVSEYNYPEFSLALKKYMEMLIESDDPDTRFIPYMNFICGLISLAFYVRDMLIQNGSYAMGTRKGISFTQTKVLLSKAIHVTIFLRVKNGDTGTS